MTVSGLIYPHAILFEGGDTITQITDYDTGFNLEDLIEMSAGQTAPQFSGASVGNPALTFSTKQIKTVLDNCATEGVVGDLSGGNVDFEYKRGLSHGLRVSDAGTSHLRARMEDNALIYWTSIAASQGQPAEISARILPVWDGVNDPLVFAGSVALTAASQAAENFTLGPIAINGTVLPGVQSMNWDNRITTEEVSDNGEPYITYGGVKDYSPQISIATRSGISIASFGPITAATAVTVYLRRKAANGINVADGTASHIKFTATAGSVRSRRLSGGDASFALDINLIKPSAAGNPFTVSTASAIT